MSSNIPLARKRLETLARLADEGRITRAQLAKQLRWISTHMLVREQAIQRTPIRRPLTQERKEAVLRLVHSNPGMDFMSVAEAAHVNTGRVSEIMNGKR